MKTIVKQVQVPEQSSALGDALKNLVVAAHQALKDGFQPGQDLPVLLIEAVKDFPAIVGNAAGALAESKESKVEVAKALALSGFEIAETLSS